MVEAPLPLDPARILRALNGRDVRYIVVGSSAAAFHGATRDPQDLDIVTPNDDRNFTQLAAALNDLHAKPWIPDLRPEDVPYLRPILLDGPSLAEYPVSLWITDAGRLDLLDAVTGIDREHSHGHRIITRAVTFEELDAEAVAAHKFGCDLRIASRAHVVEAAAATDRPQDRHMLVDLDRHAGPVQRPTQRERPRPLSEPLPGIDYPIPGVEPPAGHDGYCR